MHIRWRHLVGMANLRVWAQLFGGSWVMCLVLHLVGFGLGGRLVKMVKRDWVERGWMLLLLEPVIWEVFRSFSWVPPLCVSICFGCAQELGLSHLGGSLLCIGLLNFFFREMYPTCMLWGLCLLVGSCMVPKKFWWWFGVLWFVAQPLPSLGPFGWLTPPPRVAFDGNSFQEMRILGRGEASTGGLLTVLEAGSIDCFYRLIAWEHSLLGGSFQCEGRRQSAFPIFSLQALVLLELHPELRNGQALVLGAGASQSAQILAEKRVRVTVLDKMPELLEMADQFAPNAHEFTKVHADAGSFINETTDEYDLIIHDLCGGTLPSNQVEAHLLSTEFVGTLLGRLKPKGWLAINLFSHEANVAQQVHTWRSLGTPSVYREKTGHDNDQLGNFLIIWSQDRKLPPRINPNKLSLIHVAVKEPSAYKDSEFRESDHLKLMNTIHGPAFWEALMFSHGH